ncbi:ATP/GTP-binding protein [Geoglobus sp.]
MNVVILGPAGSGKSSLAKEFSRFLRDLGYTVAVVNLDPASPPRYSAHSDVREFVRTEDVMAREGLGINGALLRSMELALEFIDDLIPREPFDFTIYDTPGQLELFMYTDFGERFVEKLGPFTAGVFLADASRLSTPAQYSAMVAQSAVVTLMLGIPSLTVFNKADVKEVSSLDECLESLREEGVLGEFFENLLRFVEATSVIYRPVKVSARTGMGFEELFSALNELFCACGDLS